MRIRTSFFLVLLCASGFAQRYTISTVAGGDRVLDGHSANRVPLRGPIQQVFDKAGNLYIADELDNRIRKVGTSGVITTYAGIGLAGYNGDKIKATAARLNFPSSIAFDTNGNLYVADQGNSRVRMISPDGTITTVAGTGTPGIQGDGGPAIQALVNPITVAVDNQGNLYIATLDFRIRKVNAKGIITSIAGNGNNAYAGDNGPATSASIGLTVGLVPDNKGNLYLADFDSRYIRVIDAAGNIHPVAGDGQTGQTTDGIPALQAFIVPAGLVLDSTGNNLYIADVDLSHNVVERVDLTTGLIHTVAGNGVIGFQGDGGPPLQAEFNYPSGLALDTNNNLYVADFSNQRIRKITGATITTVAGTSIGDAGPAASAFLSFPEGVAVDQSGNVVVADNGNTEAREFKPGGSINVLGQVKGAPHAVAADAAGDFFVSDDEPFVLKITKGGATSIVAGNAQYGYSGDNGPATSAMIGVATGIAVDSLNDVFFTDFNTGNIRKVTSSTGIITTIAGSGSTTYSGDGGPALKAGFDPAEIAIDGTGSIYIADFLNNRIRRIGPDGTITSVAGNGSPGYSGDGGSATFAQLSAPSGVAVDAAGNLYIADQANGRVRLVDRQGLITTIAGGGIRVPSAGDGGPAIAAQLDPYHVAVDAEGRVYVTDHLNDRVRLLTPVIDTAASLNAVSGDKQSGTPGSALSKPIVVKATDAGGTGVPGVVVTFTVNPAGAATVNPSPAVTLNDGTVTAIVTLSNSAAGSLTIQASAAGLHSVTFSATAGAASPTAPVLSAGGIVSGGLSAPPITTVAVNAIASIFGDKFAPAGTAHQVSGEDLVDGKIPTNLLGVCAMFGTELAPILGVYPGQLNVQVPQLPPGEVQVQVITKCGTPQSESSNAQTVTVAAAQPEFFYFVHNTNGHDPIAAINATSKGNIGAAGLISGGSFTPAKRGDLLTLFATGFGVTNPPFGAGVLPDKAAQVTAAFSISFGGVTLAAADILYVGVTQNAGLYQVNLRVPKTVKDGDQPLAITIGGKPSPAGSFVTVKGAVAAAAPAH